ncbi:hypothetical protein WJN01_03605 [Flavobacteriaceae bacterium SZ-1-7]|uniref:hypothetical protein n=1 Tax=Tamlana sedimenti TaxID=3134126 RepID=UPI003123AA12
MKNLALILAVAFFTSISSFGQERSELTGPAYKNYKPWKNKTKTKNMYTSNSKESLTGPEYKNHKPWAKTSEAEYTQVASNNERANLTGPEYKNYKPWKNDKEEESVSTEVANNIEQE